MYRPPIKMSHTIALFAILLLIPLAIMVHYQDPELEGENLCFEGYDLRIDALLAADHAASGSLVFTPAEKDSLAGYFTGEWEGENKRVLTVRHSYEGEGTTGVADRTIIISDGYANIDWDGAGPAGLSDQRIPEVDCGA